ncbi:lytic transglycosylase domain-containing protein [Deinococcus misasensis]|uniref:lytic transglycosylase domain-containing protein n=1 Tax=Deinococcus misasensis TaxID=392413 RepID=UPI00054E2F36|nr:lytic transglycosylase domain-containing protein [Deinococcus misasensis]
MDRKNLTPYLVVGGILVGMALLPKATTVTKANLPRKVDDPVLPDPDPPKPGVPSGPKLRRYVDGVDKRPISNLYSRPRDKQAKAVQMGIYQAGYNMSQLKTMQDWMDVVAKETSGALMYKLALAFIAQCEKEKFPLDLAIGHAFAESGCRPAMTPNGAGAVGPLQVTAVAAQQVGEHWPPLSYEDAIRIGLKYMKYIRRSFPEARKSVVDCLRIYGMGYGGFQQALQLGCPGPQFETYSVWKAECGHKSYVYTKRVLEVAKRLPLDLHTVAWDKWSGKE